MKNESGLKPLGRAVLLRPYEPEIKASLIHIPDNVKQSTRVADIRGIVIAVGPECWNDEENPRAHPGDRVMVAKYAGVMVVGPYDNQVYRIVNAEDIYCQITAELEPLK